MYKLVEVLESYYSGVYEYAVIEPVLRLITIGILGQ